jgi:hypothetical protein
MRFIEESLDYFEGVYIFGGEWSANPVFPVVVESRGSIDWSGHRALFRKYFYPSHPLVLSIT